MAARQSTLKLFWTLVVGFFLLLISRAVHADSVGLHRISELLADKETVLAAYRTGHPLKFLGYDLDRKVLQSDLELFFVNLERLEQDYKKLLETTAKESAERMKSLESQSRSFHMRPLDSDRQNTDQLYEIVVAQSNNQTRYDEAKKKFERDNRLELQATELNGRRYLTRITIIRDGKSMRDQLPSVETSFQKLE